MKDIEADDPMELVGVVLPGNAETMREMAYAFAEEFARMGYDGSQIETLFKTPFYAGAYRAYLALGEAEIRTIIGESVAAWGGIVSRVGDSCSSQHEHNKGDSPLSGRGTVPLNGWSLEVTSTSHEHEHEFREESDDA